LQLVVVAAVQNVEVRVNNALAAARISFNLAVDQEPRAFRQPLHEINGRPIPEKVQSSALVDEYRAESLAAAA
jgi:hypothetical protein